MASDTAGSRSKTVQLDETAVIEAAEVLLSEEKYAEAATVYARLVSTNRARVDLLARVHYARGRHLLREGSRAEGQMELVRALQLDPDLTEAQRALDTISTRRLRRLSRSQ